MNLQFLDMRERNEGARGLIAGDAEAGREWGKRRVGDAEDVVSGECHVWAEGVLMLCEQFFVC